VIDLWLTWASLASTDLTQLPVQPWRLFPDQRFHVLGPNHDM
jgi:hypothetical protein